MEKSMSTSNNTSQVKPDIELILKQSDDYITPRQKRWMRPLNGLARCIQFTLFYANWVVMRVLFRLKVEGVNQLPAAGPFILAPNHSSSLDAPAVAAALTLTQFRSLRWIARRGVITGNRFTEYIARRLRALPIKRAIESLAVASALLDRQEGLVWFPEGTRSENGKLQDLKQGIGHLATQHRVPVVPVHIGGSFESMPPPGRRLKRFAKIVVRFGKPVVPAEDANADDFTRQLQTIMQQQAGD